MSKVKAKNYGYQSKKTEEPPRISKKTSYMILAGIVVLLGLFAVLILVEKGLENQIIVKNKSSHNITKLHFWYEDAEGNCLDVMTFDEGVKAKERISESTEELALSELSGEAFLSVRIEFEDGGSAVVQTGHFLYGFNGRISFEVSDTKREELALHLKAGEGLFNSSAVTGCDDVYYINPKDGYIE